MKTIAEQQTGRKQQVYQCTTTIITTIITTTTTCQLHAIIFLEIKLSYANSHVCVYVYVFHSHIQSCKNFQCLSFPHLSSSCLFSPKPALISVLIGGLSKVLASTITYPYVLDIEYHKYSTFERKFISLKLPWQLFRLPQLVQNYFTEKWLTYAHLIAVKYVWMNELPLKILAIFHLFTNLSVIL